MKAEYGSHAGSDICAGSDLDLRRMEICDHLFEYMHLYGLSSTVARRS